MPGAKTWIVVPCYDEAKRLRTDEFARFTSQHPDVHFLFVDDGSTDGTRVRIEQMTVRKGSVSLLTLAQNQGKAEAVRRGMNEAFERGAVYAGYWDADLATPLAGASRSGESEGASRVGVGGKRAARGSETSGYAARRSGARRDREGLGALVAAAQNEQFDVVLVDDLSRLAPVQSGPIGPRLSAGSGASSMAPPRSGLSHPRPVAWDRRYASIGTGRGSEVGQSGEVCMGTAALVPRGGRGRPD
jgi:hypothetical protein